MGSCRLNLVRAVALFLGFATLVFACMGFGTNYWLEFDVDRDILTGGEFYLSTTNVDLGRVTFTRHRGIFRECYSDDNVPFLAQTDDEVDSDCFELEFEDPDRLDVSDDFSTRLGLLRCVIAFYVIGIVLSIATIIVAIVSICRRTLKWVVYSSLCALFTGLFVATAIAFFLGVDHMEREEGGDPSELIFRKNWSPTLDEATSTEFGWSFALSWLAVCLAFICALLYLVIALSMRSSQDDGSSDTSSESDKSDKAADDYSRHHAYAINAAYQGNLNPVYSPYDNKSRPSRRALQLAVPSDHSGHGSPYGPQMPGTFIYGLNGGLLPSVSYMQPPDLSHSRSSRKE